MEYGSVADFHNYALVAFLKKYPLLPSDLVIS